MKVLLIWDQCGAGELRLFELWGDLADLAVAANGEYINSSDLPEDSAVHALSEALLWTADGEEIKSHPEGLEITSSDKDRGPYHRIVIAGFLP